MLPFTGPLKEVCELAAREANRLRHPTIGPGHYLLAMIRHGADVGTLALNILKIDLSELKALLERMLGIGDGPSFGDVAPNRMSEHTLADASKIAKSMENDFVSTGHLLLAIMDEDDSPAALALAQVGVDYAELARQVILLHEGSHAISDPEEIAAEAAEADEAAEEEPRRKPLDVPESMIEAAAGTDLELEWVELSQVDFTRAVTSALPIEVIRDLRVIPVAVEGDRVTIAMADPLLMPQVLQMCERLDLVADLKVCSFEDYERALVRHFGGI